MWRWDMSHKFDFRHTVSRLQLTVLHHLISDSSCPAPLQAARGARHDDRNVTRQSLSVVGAGLQRHNAGTRYSYSGEDGRFRGRDLVHVWGMGVCRN